MGLVGFSVSHLIFPLFLAEGITTRSVERSSEWVTKRFVDFNRLSLLAMQLALP